MLVKVCGNSKNYFIKSKYPIRNRQQMLNKMRQKYDNWEKNNFVGKPLTFSQHYLKILLDKIFNQ